MKNTAISTLPMYRIQPIAHWCWTALYSLPVALRGPVCAILLYMRKTLHLELVRLCALLTFMLQGRGGLILATPTKLRMLTGRAHKRASMYLQKAGAPVPARLAHGPGAMMSCTNAGFQVLSLTCSA